MAINIKNDETGQLVRQLAEMTGESVTTVVTVAVEQRLARVRDVISPEQRAAHLVELGRQIAAELGPKPMRPEELYDPVTGLPA